MRDSLASIGMDVWKRIAVYPLLAIVLGHGCGCQRPSLLTNAILALMAVVGFAGVAACLRDARGEAS